MQISNEHSEIKNELQAISESLRCLQCFDAPCTSKCPVHIPVPRFIRMIRSGNTEGSVAVVKESHPFIHTCGEICPDESFCTSVCTRGKIDRPVRIRELHRYITNFIRSEQRGSFATEGFKNGKVAVVGAGPAGLSCAKRLALKGVVVDVFEMKEKHGGILFEQIPLFRLSPKILRMDVHEILNTGINLKYKKSIEDIKELAERYDAVFIATGASMPVRARIPGENFENVWTHNDFLKALKEDGSRILKKVEKVVVIGGGNSAVDCALSALHYGARTAEIYYRRGVEEMPAWKNEVSMAIARGVEFHFLCIPVRFAGKKGKLEGVEFIEAKLGKAGEDGRRIPVPVRGSNFFVRCDICVVAIGSKPRFELIGSITGKPEFSFDKKTMRLKGVKGNVFIGGDFAGRGTVVEAVSDGITAAEEIYKLLQKKYGGNRK